VNSDVNWVVESGNATLDGSIFDPSNSDLTDYIFSYTISNPNTDCLNTTRLTITVNDGCIACNPEDIIISKAVTPNGDQWNEYFTITGIDLCGFTIDLQIFNRWGAKIYASKNYQNNWNGTVHKNSFGNADKVTTGTYYYVINLIDSGLKPFSGPIYIRN